MKSFFSRANVLNNQRRVNPKPTPKVYHELCQVVEEWIEMYGQDGETLPAETAGKDYSGKFVLRVGKDLHKELTIDALRHGESLNTHCVRLLREKLVHYEKHEQA